jgi:hypothetical protein
MSDIVLYWHEYDTTCSCQLVLGMSSHEVNNARIVHAKCERSNGIDLVRREPHIIFS